LGAVPVPLSGTFSVGAFDGILRSALFDPAEAGEKSACTVQLDEGATVLPEQVSFCVPNSPAFVPVGVIVPTTRLAPPVFVTVKVCAADELPAVIFP
jgi:hypothetical protein